MSASGCHPTFLGLGAAKCGTTTMAALLAEHPDVAFPRSGRKELHFFDETPISERTLAAYRSEFTPNRATGEWTPSYLFDPKCCGLIAETLGTDIGLLVMLRDPCARAWSHYWHAVRNWSHPRFREKGYPEETLSFREAIEAEPERLASGRFHIRHQSYFAKGVYADQLSAYVERFGRGRVWVGLLEDLASDPASVLASCCRFLGIDPAPMLARPVERLNRQAEEAMPTETRAWLRDRYLPSIERLEAMLGRGLDAWKA